jgi:DNA-binding NarL/FixJ family response regulator
VPVTDDGRGGADPSRGTGLHGVERRLAAFDGTLALHSPTGGPTTDERPDVAVVDIRLPPSFTDEGPQAALAARRQIPGLPVLVLSQYVEQLYARELLADSFGAVGYLLKDRISQTEQFIRFLPWIPRPSGRGGNGTPAEQGRES